MSRYSYYQNYQKYRVACEFALCEEQLVAVGDDVFADHRQHFVSTRAPLCVAVSRRELQGVAGCCRVLQCVAVCLPVTGSVSSRLGPRPVLQGVAGCCRVLQGVANTKNMHL